MRLSEVVELVGAAPAPKAPCHDTWGIINWADCPVFRLVPAARKALLRDAATRRYVAHHAPRRGVTVLGGEPCPSCGPGVTEELERWLAYADWIDTHWNAFETLRSK